MFALLIIAFIFQIGVQDAFAHMCADSYHPQYSGQQCVKWRNNACSDPNNRFSGSSFCGPAPRAQPRQQRTGDTVNLEPMDLSPGEIPVEEIQVDAPSIAQEDPAVVEDRIARRCMSQNPRMTREQCIENPFGMSGRHDQDSAGSLTGSESDAAEAESCEDRYQDAKKVCDKSGPMGYVFMAAAAYQQTVANGSLKEQCGAAKKLNVATGGVAGSFAAKCVSAVRECVSICETAYKLDRDYKFKRNLEACDDYNRNAQMLTGQSVANGIAALQNADCEKAASGSCQGQEAFNDENCMQFCFVPGRQTHKKCDLVAQQCAEPNYARSNPMCVCVTNPSHSSCPGGSPPNPLTPPPPTTVAGGGVGGLLDSLFGDDEPPGFEGNPPGSGGPGGAGAPSGGGGSAAAPSGGSTAGGYQPGEDGGYAGNPTNDQILNGVARTGGGFPMGYGTSASGGNGRYAASGGGGRDAKELNLRDFLPGGKKDSRGIASKALAASGISASDGLSNWAKVNRKMSEKRPSLLP